MSSALIGLLLDEALAFATSQSPKPITVQASVIGSSGASGERTIEPRSVARALLANHLRELLMSLPGGLISEDGDQPTYSGLLSMCRESTSTTMASHFEADSGPDATYSPSKGGPLTAIEVGYGFEAEAARDAVDRLLHLSWFTTGPHSYRSVEMVGYIFVQELRFGDIVRRIERSFDDWLDENYGPFAGLDRIHLPMMPRLTRTALASPRDGTVISAIDLKSRPTGFAAFCVSYLRDQP